MTDQEKLLETLDLFQPLSLDDMDSVKLMIRKDKKYIFPRNKLITVLEQIKDNYHILEIGGLRRQAYTTTYFDTVDMDLYLMHHRGKLNRQKIRLRKYNTDGASFLEIKRKSNLGVTNKSRVEVESDACIVLNEEEEFISKLMPFGVRELKTVLNNEFNRITLVNLTTKERVTLDLNVRLNKEGTDDWVGLGGVCIAEIKRSGNFYKSQFAKALKNNKIYPMRFSKYCYGVAKTYDELPINRFKEKFRKVDSINEMFE